MPTRTCMFSLTVTCAFAGLAARPDRASACPGPSVRETVDAALARADLVKPRAAGWRRGLDWAALLPRLTARFARSTGRSEYWNLGPRAPDQDLNSRLALRWELRATWDLSRLLFDGREIGVSRRASQLSAERRQLAQAVIELYYERCHLVHIRQPNKKPRTTPSSADTGPGDETEVRLKVVTALIRTLTGLSFQKSPGSDSR